MKKYMTGGFGKELIKEVECTKETEKTVWIETYWKDKKSIQQERKKSDWHNYFDTFEDAQNFLIEKSENRISAYEENTKNEKEYLERIKNFKLEIINETR